MMNGDRDESREENVAVDEGYLAIFKNNTTGEYTLIRYESEEDHDEKVNEEEVRLEAEEMDAGLSAREIEISYGIRMGGNRARSSQRVSGEELSRELRGAPIASASELRGLGGVEELERKDNWDE